MKEKKKDKDDGDLGKEQLKTEFGFSFLFSKKKHENHSSR